MRKPFYSVVTNSVATNGRINIYGVIGPDYWNDGVEAKKFVRDLALLENSYERIDIHINSPGGSIWDGLPIFNAIRASKKDVHTYVDGIAFSMGCIIALAGHTVHVAKGSLMMIHNASGFAAGNSKRLRSAADMLDKHDDVLSQLISDKSGKTVEEVKSLWMNMNDNFFTATEAIELKLADVMESYDAKEMPENAENMSLHQVAAFYNERTEEPNPSLLTKIYDNVKNHFSNNQNSNMDITKIKALGGETAPSQTLLDEANAELTKAGVTNAVIVPESVINEAANVTKERDQLKTTNSTLTNDLNVANTAKTKAESDLETANTALQTSKDEVTALKSKLANMPGARHEKPSNVEDELTETEEEKALQAQLDALPHNQNADKLLG